jgi:hypothetical protein
VRGGGRLPVDEHAEPGGGSRLGRPVTSAPVTSGEGLMDNPGPPLDGPVSANSAGVEQP